MGLDLSALFGGISRGLGSATDIQLAEHLRQIASQEQFGQRQQLASEAFDRDKELRIMLDGLMAGREEDRFTRQAELRGSERAEDMKIDARNTLIGIAEKKKDRDARRENALISAGRRDRPSPGGVTEVDGLMYRHVFDPASQTDTLVPVTNPDGSQAKAGRQSGDLTERDIEVMSSNTADEAYIGLVTRMFMGGKDPMSEEGKAELDLISRQMTDPQRREALFAQIPALRMYYNLVKSYAKQLHSGDLSQADFDTIVQQSLPTDAQLGISQIENDDDGGGFLSGLAERVGNLRRGIGENLPPQ